MSADMRTGWRKALRNELARHPAMYRVLSALANYGDPSGANCRPTVETLMRKSRTSRPTVLRTLSWARETGWIQQVYRGSRVKGRASLYVLRMGTVGAAPDYSRPAPKPVDNPAQYVSPVIPNALVNTYHRDTPPISLYPDGGTTAPPVVGQVDRERFGNQRSDGREPLAPVVATRDPFGEPCDGCGQTTVHARHERLCLAVTA